MKCITIVNIVALGVGLLMAPTVTPVAEQHELHAAKGMICDVCGMYIEVFRRTAVEVAFDNGRTECFCGVACALRCINEHLGLPHVKSAHATDWNTQAAVPLEHAVLVVGSDQTPDMIPNYIAFRSEEEAAAFRKQHGGTAIPLERALADISYAGMTTPFRITPAPTPPARLFSTGVAVSRMVKDKLLEGSDEISTQDALKSRPMAPRQMDGTLVTLAAGYAVGDDVFLDVALPYASKELKSEKQTGERMTFEEDGLGDTTVSGRWRFYHDALSNRHLALVLRAALPTGQFKEEHRARPGLQLGTEAFGAAGGLLYSQHLGLFWLNGGVEYRYNAENSADYKFGDVLQGGVAVHFVPSTKTMLGVECDASKAMKNEDLGANAPNTGCEAVYASLVGQQRIALFWGGNFDLRAIVGAPVYEDVEGVQLGEAYHAGVGLQWKRRF